MSLIYSPYGFQTTLHTSGSSRPTASPGNYLVSGASYSLFQFQPIKLDDNGHLVPLTATTDILFGIFEGAHYSTYTSGWKSQPWFPAGTVLTANPSSVINSSFTNQIVSWYGVNMEIEMRVQANGPMTAAALGKTFNIDITTATNGNINGGRSQCALSNQVANNGMFICCGLLEVPDNGWGDAFTEVLVKFNPNNTNFG